MKIKKQTVYVYEDTDNNVIEVFDNRKKAEAFLKECWGVDDAPDLTMQDVLDEGYVSIYKREVK